MSTNESEKSKLGNDQVEHTINSMPRKRKAQVKDVTLSENKCMSPKYSIEILPLGSTLISTSEHPNIKKMHTQTEKDPDQLTQIQTKAKAQVTSRLLRPKATVCKSSHCVLETPKNLNQSRKRPYSLDKDYGSKTEDTPSSSPTKSPSPKLRCNPPRRASFRSHYTTGKFLGKGGFGDVYEGVRKSDGKQVAIKYILKGTVENNITIPGSTWRLPLEVGLMYIVSKPPACKYIVELIDWFEQPTKYIVVMERPIPCVDMYDYLSEMGGMIDEPLAKMFMLQVVLAVMHCRDRGVLHRDLKTENLLVKTDTLELKLIDFGCGDLLRDQPYRDFAGTEEFSPPEWVLDGKYQGRKATTWSLGVLLFNMVCGDLPFNKEADIVDGHLCFKRGLSKGKHMRTQKNAKNLLDGALNKTHRRDQFWRRYLFMTGFLMGAVRIRCCKRMWGWTCGVGL